MNLTQVIQALMEYGGVETVLGAVGDALYNMREEISPDFTEIRKKFEDTSLAVYRARNDFRNK